MWLNTNNAADEDEVYENYGIDVSQEQNTQLPQVENLQNLVNLRGELQNEKEKKTK